MCEFVNDIWTPCSDPSCPSKRPYPIDLLREALKPKEAKPELTDKAKRQLELIDQLESIFREHFGGGGKEKK